MPEFDFGNLLDLKPIVDKPTNRQTNKQTDKSTDKPTDKPADVPTNEPTDKGTAPGAVPSTNPLAGLIESGPMRPRMLSARVSPETDNRIERLLIYLRTHSAKRVDKQDVVNELLRIGLDLVEKDFGL